MKSGLSVSLRVSSFSLKRSLTNSSSESGWSDYIFYTAPRLLSFSKPCLRLRSPFDYFRPPSLSSLCECLSLFPLYFLIIISISPSCLTLPSPLSFPSPSPFSSPSFGHTPMIPVTQTPSPPFSFHIVTGRERQVKHKMSTLPNTYYVEETCNLVRK